MSFEAIILSMGKKKRKKKRSGRPGTNGRRSVRLGGTEGGNSLGRTVGVSPDGVGAVGVGDDPTATARRAQWRGRLNAAGTGLTILLATASGVLLGANAFFAAGLMGQDGDPVELFVARSDSAGQLNVDHVQVSVSFVPGGRSFGDVYLYFHARIANPERLGTGEEPEPLISYVPEGAVVGLPTEEGVIFDGARDTIPPTAIPSLFDWQFDGDPEEEGGLQHTRGVFLDDPEFNAMSMYWAYKVPASLTSRTSWDRGEIVVTWDPGLIRLAPHTEGRPSGSTSPELGFSICADCFTSMQPPAPETATPNPFPMQEFVPADYDEPSQIILGVENPIRRYLQSDPLRWFAGAVLLVALAGLFLSRFKLSSPSQT